MVPQSFLASRQRRAIARSRWWRTWFAAVLRARVRMDVARHGGLLSVDSTEEGPHRPEALRAASAGSPAVFAEEAMGYSDPPLADDNTGRLDAHRFLGTPDVESRTWSATSARHYPSSRRRAQGAPLG
jgi:hypothetical protein